MLDPLMARPRRLAPPLRTGGGSALDANRVAGRRQPVSLGFG
jgi:hypothetical protein